MEGVADLIAGEWRRLARKLGHEENIIEQIDLDYTKTYEKSYQILTRWRRDTPEATWKTLKAKLDSMPRYDIVREIEKKFPQGKKKFI